MNRKVLLTYTLSTEDIAKSTPSYLAQLEGAVFNTRRLKYGFDPSQYLVVVHIGARDSKMVENHWVRGDNTFILTPNRYQDAEEDYPHRKFSEKEWIDQEAQRMAGKVKKKMKRKSQ